MYSVAAVTGGGDERQMTTVAPEKQMRQTTAESKNCFIQTKSKNGEKPGKMNKRSKQIK